MVLGGERGLVTLHLPGGLPDCMVLHSPEEAFGWDGPNECARLEGWCWCLSSITGAMLRDSMPEGWRERGEEGLWALMEEGYELYLARGRR